MKLTKEEQARVKAVTNILLDIGVWEHSSAGWSCYRSRSGVELGHLAVGLYKHPDPDKAVIAWSAAHGNQRVYFPTRAEAIRWIESTYTRE